MFKSIFKRTISDSIWLKIALSLTLIIAVVLISTYFLLDSFTTVPIIILGIIIFIILSNWVVNVMFQRGKLRKKVPKEYIKLSKEYNSTIEVKDFAEIYLYAKGLAFTLLTFPSLIITIIFLIF